MENNNPEIFQNILKECILNDRKAQNALFKMFSPYLLGVASRYTRDRQEAKEVFLDAFELIFRKLDKYDSNKGHFKSWIKVITINVALNKIQARSKLPVSEIEKLPEPIYENSFDSDIDLQLILKIVSGIRPPYGLIFNMVMDGYKHKEIASKLGIAENTCRSYYKRSKALIQQELAKQKMDITYD